MTPTPLRVGLVLATLGATLAGCTGPGPLDAPNPAVPTPPVAPAGPYQLVAFDTCANLLDELRTAAKASAQAGGFNRRLPMDGAADNMARDSAAKAPTGDGSAGYSGTNNHEAGVEEPDTVKTDGRRIVTVRRGVLRVIDPATRRVTGELDLARVPVTAPGYEPMRWSPTNLLLAGDRALVLTTDAGLDAAPAAPSKRMAQWGAVRAILVDLSGSPRLVSSYRIDGALVDARQVGNTARLVVRGNPRLDVPYWDGQTESEWLADYRALIDKAPIGQWLPRYEIETGGRVETGNVECDEVRRPDAYSALETLTLASFDLAADSLGRGDPLTLVADGETVYGTATSLYVATGERWRLRRAVGGGVRSDVRAPGEPATTIYRFDTSGAVPVFVGGGRVSGYLLNQYALSEWDGTLRVATTTSEPWTTGDRAPRSESAVSALRLVDGQLKQVGHVGGLGKGERIFGVRFAGPIGYVVTFRQVDPLYTVDLADPTRPTVRGELKVDGYSAYLHPLDGTRLLGVGQDVRDGRTRGTQVAVFDVADLDKPRRVSRLTITGSSSDAEYDPHAFLYWPATGTVVLPTYDHDRFDGRQGATAVVLRVVGSDVRTVGSLTHPVRGGSEPYQSKITRSLVIDGVLWTVSDAGLQANDLGTLARQAWLPYD
ncbi:beta-propeller domain-containing protein [Luedemannella helvata]|uniref:Beta-propeller domain-containing protein n=1 Tax=Luedemannella helvata TaxID=349315 RepID=A0ABN2L0R2_9ACTN